MSCRRRSWLSVVALPTSLAATLVGCDGVLPPEPPAQPAFLTAPNAPSNTNAVALAYDKIKISWKDNSSNETGFKVHLSTSGPTGTFSLRASTAANITTYSDAGLAPLKSYCYKIRAFKTQAGTTSYSAFSSAVCATTPPPPAPPGPQAPSGTSATPTASDALIVTWIDNSVNEEWFRVEHSATSTGPWAFVGTLLGSGYTSYTAWGLPSEKQLCYRVIALNAQGESSPSNTDCTTPPAAPTGLTAIRTDGPAIDLRWADNSSAEDGYEVQRRTSAGTPFGTVADLPANTTSYRDVSVSADQTYSYAYAVRAKKDGGYSYLSNHASVPNPSPTPPAAPGLSQPEGYYLGTMWLFWWNPGNVDSYTIERCDKESCEDADFTVIATVNASTSSMAYQDWGLADWTIYTYRIRATNQAGDSEPSGQMQGRTCIEEVDWYSPCFPPLP